MRPEEQGEIFAEVLNETLANQQLMQSFGANPLAPAPAAQSQQEAAPPPPPQPTYYSSMQAVPEAAARSGQPIYKPTDLVQLLGDAASGRAVPSGVKRACRRANGVTTGEFLLKQADLLGVPVPPEMKEKVQKVARVEQGTSEAIASAAPVSTSPLAYASNALLNILDGHPPAVAATLPPELQTPAAELGAPTALNSFSRQVSSITYDTGQPGIDVFFEDKQFLAVLDGRVKEVSYQGTATSGYGNYVVIESRDPQTRRNS